MKNKKIEKLIKNLELLSNEIKETIETYTEMTKTGYYKIFKESIFTSINHKIEDRKINPNFFEECEEFIDDLFEFIRNNGKENIISKFTKTINGKTEVDEKSLDKLFYIDEEPLKMTIQDYFNCEPKTRPKQLEILSDRTTNILKKCKRNIDELLSINNQYALNGNKIPPIIFISPILKLASFLLNKQYEKIYIDKLNAIYELNKMFFDKIKTVRKTVAKYILIGQVGPLFYYITEGPNSDKITVIADGIMRFNDWLFWQIISFLVY